MNGCKPSKWSWGLIPVLFVAFLVIAGEGPKIEQELTKRSALALEQKGFVWARVMFNGRDGVLTGTAFGADERNAALELISGIRGVGRVQDRAELLPVVSPYTWWITRKGNRVKIKGHVPTKADQQTILGIIKATMPELEIDDRMKLAAGAPPKQQWLGAISFTLNQLGQMKEGNAHLSDMELLLAGEASSENAYKAVRNALATQLPSGLTVARHNVIAPAITPYSWGMVFRDGKIKLTGYVPDEQSRKRLLDAVDAAFRGSSVEDGMVLGSGAPKQWSEVMLLAVSQLARLDEGQVVVRGIEFSIDGIAVDDTTAADVAHKVRNSLPPSFKSVEKVGTRDGARPEQRPKAQPGGKAEKTMARPPSPDDGEWQRVRFWPRSYRRDGRDRAHERWVCLPARADGCGRAAGRLG